MDALLGRVDANAAVRWLRPDDRIGAAQRLQVYRHNLFENATAALQAVYPVVTQLVGKAYFRQLARSFIRAQPSRSGNLQDFGQGLPLFIATVDGLSELPYLADVARLEWAWHVAYHAAVQPGLAIDALAAVPVADQPGLRLRWQPGVSVLRSAHPVLAIWSAHQPGADDATVSLDDGGIDLLVAPQALDVEFRRLAPGEAAWLLALADGLGLADASAAALEDSAVFDLGAALARHVGRGVFTPLAMEVAYGD
jgi:hypothetical protein